jgi:hypothetical protein
MFLRRRCSGSRLASCRGSVTASRFRRARHHGNPLRGGGPGVAILELAVRQFAVPSRRVRCTPELAWQRSGPSPCFSHGTCRAFRRRRPGRPPCHACLRHSQPRLWRRAADRERGSVIPNGGTAASATGQPGADGASVPHRHPGRRLDGDAPAQGRAATVSGAFGEFPNCLAAIGQDDGLRRGVVR